MSRQFFIPNWGYVNATANRQHLVPGEGYFNDTGASTSSASFSAAGHAAVAAAGKSTATSTLSVAGHAIAAFVAPHASTFAVVGQAAVGFVGRTTAASSLSAAGRASASFAGTVPAQTKSYFIPDWGYFNQGLRRDFLVPSWGSVNDAVNVGSFFSAAGKASAGFAAGPSKFVAVGRSVFSGRSNALTPATITAAGAATAQFSGQYAFYTVSAVFNMDDISDIVSFAPYSSSQAVAAVHGFATASFAGNALTPAPFVSAGHASASFAGHGSASSGGQFDFSTPINSEILPGVMT